ncbi:MAG: UvrD-helicase domain-containing protein, partial [Peptostreptococcaceae bacterium]|nr:UvrD-helicase domain-containing protein [Peptostreptococcaceae bacterium]
NEVHNSIIQSISQKDNLFFVGDVKQSIYGFRLADPSIFMQKYESYKKNDNSIKIDLSSNFRSTKQILDFCNKIFEIIINEQTSSMKYDEDAKLISNDKYCYNQEHIQINLLDRDSEIEDDIALDLQKDDIMAQVTAKQILEIMNKDKSIKFSDIAVLKRSFSNSISSYQKAFRKYNIPVFIDYSSAIFEVLEVSIFIDLLNIIDNIRQDIPLISVMMSNIGGFTIQEITQIKSYDIKTKYFHQILLKYANDEEKKDDGLSKKVSKFINKIANYTRLERYMRLDEFIEFVMIDSKYKDYVLSMKSGDMRFQNLSIVTEKAREFMQNENKSLFNFLTYINSILKNKSDKEEPQKISENQNVVRIMSIHKSKGLEFPIVILNDIDKKFNTIDTKKQIVLESNFGIGVDYVNLQEDYYTKTLAKRCIINKIQKNNLAEEIRILYV